MQFLQTNDCYFEEMKFVLAAWWLISMQQKIIIG